MNYTEELVSEIQRQLDFDANKYDPESLRMIIEDNLDNVQEEILKVMRTPVKNEDTEELKNLKVRYLEASSLYSIFMAEYCLTCP